MNLCHCPVCTMPWPPWPGPSVCPTCTRTQLVQPASTTPTCPPSWSSRVRRLSCIGRAVVSTSECEKCFVHRPRDLQETGQVTSHWCRLGAVLTFHSLFSPACVCERVLTCYSKIIIYLSLLNLDVNLAVIFNIYIYPPHFGHVQRSLRK